MNSCTSSLSNYLIQKSPMFYGGKQDEYSKMAEQAIASSVNLISEEITSGTELFKIYDKVTSFLQNARHEIALKHQPEKAHLFGIRRYDAKVHQESYAPPMTGLYSPYEEYNTKYIERLTHILARIPHTLRSFEKTSISTHEIIMGKNCSFEVELLDLDQLSKRKYTAIPSEQDLQKALGIKNKSALEIIKDYDLMNRLKIEEKDLYNRIGINPILCHINTVFPTPLDTRPVTNLFQRHERKNIYVLGTLRLEIEPKKMVCLTKHLTWMYQDYVQDPVSRMKEHSVDFVIHQDPFLIERTQNACGQIFADILKWDHSKSMDSLKDNIALLRFIYGNSMPCSRGDGAIGDWLELALYRHHGFIDTKHSNDRLPCFELLSTTNLSQYLQTYKDTTTVK